MAVFLALCITACSLQPAPTLVPPLVDPTSRSFLTQTILPTVQAPSSQSTATVPAATVVNLPSPSATPSSPTIHFDSPSFLVVAKNLPGPDDLALAPDGSVYFSDVVSGAIGQLAPDGSLQTVITGLSAPEGLLFLPGGSLLIAEQGKNRLVLYDFQKHTLSPFLDLPNRTGLEGVDGLALDARPGQPVTIIIPDSPNGKLLRSSLDGKQLTTIASDFARPTGAWVEPGGSLLVVDENANRLVRLHPDGSLDKLADLSIPDDVVVDSAGYIYVACIGDNQVHILSQAGQPLASLAGIVSGPQGLLFTQDGSLLVTDPGHYRIIKFVSGK